MSTSLVTVDPPHMVYTGAACASCCKIAPGELLRCGGCGSAWYCNQDCQRAHFKVHKPFCKALKLFQALQADLPPESWPCTPLQFYTQRVNVFQVLQPMLRRPLSRDEHRALLGEARCSVCMRTRGQLARMAQRQGPQQGQGQGQEEHNVEQDSSGPEAGDVGKPGGATVGAPGQEAAGKGTGAGAGAGAAAAPAAGAPGLSCCPHCHWGWVCGAHREAYLAGPHAAVCLPYRLMNDSHVLTHRYLTATGRVPNYTFDTPRFAETAAPAAASAATAASAAASGPPSQGQHKGAGGSGSMKLYGAKSGGASSAQEQQQQGPNAGAPGAGVGAAAAAAAAWERLPAGWTAYRGWRPMPSFDEGTLALLSKRLSQALTVAQALQHHYTPAQLAAKRHVEVHVLGAGAFEVPADRAWEELLNLLPPLDLSLQLGPVPNEQGEQQGQGHGGRDGADRPVGRSLHVAFTGPELYDIIMEESDGLALPQGSALTSPPPGRQLLYSHHLCTYQEFATGKRDAVAAAAAVAAMPPAAAAAAPSAAVDGPPAAGTRVPWRRPDVAVAFNSGVSELDKELWAPALQVLVRQDVPVVFTSYNAQEAKADAAAWRAAGGVLTGGPERNGFRALEPVAEPSQVDVFYYQNGYVWYGRGAPPAAPVT